MSDYIEYLSGNKEQKDAINPSYYKDSYPFEVIDLIKRTLTPEQFIGFCLGNEIKYRMRAGIKSNNVQQDIDKALWYNKARKEAQ